VYWKEHAKKWIALINAGNKRYLGYFASAEEAARAWDTEAIKLRGEFAVLNFPNR
jgi:hypothetical protein